MKSLCVSLLLINQVRASCNSDEDCAEGQTCYRPGTQFSACITGLGSTSQTPLSLSLSLFKIFIHTHIQIPSFYMKK